MNICRWIGHKYTPWSDPRKGADELIQLTYKNGVDARQFRTCNRCQLMKTRSFI